MNFHVQFPGLGLAFTVSRVALQIGSFSIYWYGIMIAIGMMLALLFVFHYAQDFGLDADRMVDVIVVGTVMAVVCARTYYVLLSPYSYSSLWEMIDIRQGGIAVYGSIFGAFFFGGLACKWRKIPLLPMFDAVAIGFLMGQGMGRWGNFFNQEAFGCNTTLPWGMISEETTAYLQTAPITVPAGVTIDPSLPVHPTFLYESLWCLLGFAVFALTFKKRKFNGEIFLLYVIWYGVERFFVEGLRTDSLLVAANLRMSQIVALVSVAAALVLEIIFHRRYAGKPLLVPLSVTTENLTRLKKAGKTDFTPDTLPATASHADFVRATDEMNRRIAETDWTKKAEEPCPAEQEKTEETAAMAEEQTTEAAAAPAAEPPAETENIAEEEQPAETETPAEEAAPESGTAEAAENAEPPESIKALISAHTTARQSTGQEKTENAETVRENTAEKGETDGSTEN